MCSDHTAMHAITFRKTSIPGIDADPGNPSLTLARLAATAGVSRYQLIRAFSEQRGLPPHAYIVQRRLAMARWMIRSGRSLADAAHSAGFVDQSHLTNAFRRQLGVSPGRYARAWC